MRKPTVRHHRAPKPLHNNDPTCIFYDDYAMISYGYWHFGEKNVIGKTCCDNTASAC